ncbi:50S ribosomal protein L2 [Candidatus Woesearchaeota archaeon]|nr:50S ribosomal protein L2 [Candidatus Woesearchaeota archaeon]
MGKRIISQRRGRATRRFIAPSHRYFAEAKHKTLDDKSYFGKVVEILHSTSHTAPLALIQYEDGNYSYIIAPEGIAVGDIVATGKKAEIKVGNTMQLSEIPEGTLVYNIESKLGDGGKFVRSSGTFARVLAKTGDKVKILMPSKKEKEFHINCRATIGVVSGGGRTDKPFIKAGNRWHAMRAKGRLYPIVSAVAMNAVEHPFGSGRGRHMGKPNIAPRNAPPGRKVGLVRPRRTGRIR